jgi:putative ABC transport system permease protein
MSNLWRDIRYAIRQLSKAPGFTLTIIVTLALGIGANTAIFTVDYATLLAPLPNPHPEQLVMVWSTIQTYHHVGVSTENFLDWKQQSGAFQDMNAWSGAAFNIAGNNQPEYVSGTRATSSYFQMMGSPFALGRGFLPEEGQLGKEHVVVLTHKFWKHLGSNPNIIGTTLRLDSIPYTVVGVLAAGPADRGQAQLTVPLVFQPAELNRDTPWLLVMGRLKPGITIQQAAANVNAVSVHLAEEYPKSNKGWGSSVEPLKDDFLPQGSKKLLWLLLCAVGFVLLIACVNVANLLLARSMTMQKEVAIRSALGAKPGRIFAQFLTESLLLAIAGGAAGVGVGYAMLRGLIAIIPLHVLPDEADLRLNLPILFFTLVASTFAGLLFGTAPSWYASRVDPGEALKEGGRSGTGAGRHRLRRLLVAGEFALTLTLLAGAGLAIHSFWNLSHVDVGIPTDHVLTFSLSVPDSRSKNPDRVISYYGQLLASIDAVPGVLHASAMMGVPLQGAGFSMQFTIAGKPAYADPSQRPVSGFNMVTPDYFQTFGIQVLQGRAFTDQDSASSVKVAMVNQKFVDKFLKGTDPLQQRVLVPQLPTPGVAQMGPPVEWQIIGVTRNVRSRGLRANMPEIDVPFGQSPWSNPSIGVRTAEDPARMTQSIAAAVHAINPEIALVKPRTLEQVRNDALVGDRLLITLLLTLAGIALLLATVGIYGVMSFSVVQRAHEIAIRMALGASRNKVVLLVVREGVLLASIGLGFGFLGAYLVGRVLQMVLFGVRALDLASFSAVGFLLLLAALLACYLPARRAASTNPMQALREE